MKQRFVTLFFIFGLFLYPGLLRAETYFLDCADGDDARDGRSPEAAWKSLERVARQEFGPGDRLLVRRGTRCEGMLKLHGSGKPGSMNIVSAYGQGPLPLIDGRGEEAALELIDESYWVIEKLELTGSRVYGVHVGAQNGPVRGIVLQGLVVHGVHGELKTKASGLVAVLGHGEQGQLEDIVIDGLTCFDTSQWAGIIVMGSSKEVRARRVVVRNSIVHHTFGDGIVLFQVEDGLIEYCAAWLTGLQPRETIGTPNGIWTWRCRRCVVQWNEGFFTDSPGVDGGVYDVDWGNEDNVVQYNFGHDAQGYCLSVFGAQGEATRNSLLRYNVCVNNGRSPKLARRQGDVYITTWEGGAIDGVEIVNNTFYWNPSEDAPVVKVEGQTRFIGASEKVFRGNVIYSTSPRLIDVAAGLELEGNVYWQRSGLAPIWAYKGKTYTDFVHFRKVTGQEATGCYGELRLSGLLEPMAGSPAKDLVVCGKGVAKDAFGRKIPWGRRCDAGAIESVEQRAAEERQSSQRVEVAQLSEAVDINGRASHGRWKLIAFLDAGDRWSRSQLVFLKAAAVQYRHRGLDVVTVWRGRVAELRQLSYELDLGALLVFAAEQVGLEKTLGVKVRPTVALVNEEGLVVWQHEGFAPAALLGLKLRAELGPPRGSPEVEVAEED